MRSCISSGRRARLRLSHEWSGTRSRSPSPRKVPQRQAVGAAPLQAALAVDALEVAGQVPAELTPGRQRRRPQDGHMAGTSPRRRRRNQRRSAPPASDRRPRRLRQLVPGHQHLALPWPLPPHRHGWHSSSLFYRQRISRRPDFVNGLL
jgi:hypothetical protein